jgi:hypothetical protein
VKPELKGLLGRPKCSWEDNIEMDLKEMGWKGVEWIFLVTTAHVNTVVTDLMVRLA